MLFRLNSFNDENLQRISLDLGQAETTSEQEVL